MIAWSRIDSSEFLWRVQHGRRHPGPDPATRSDSRTFDSWGGRVSRHRKWKGGQDLHHGRAKAHCLPHVHASAFGDQEAECAAYGGDVLGRHVRPDQLLRHASVGFLGLFYVNSP